MITVTADDVLNAGETSSNVISSDTTANKIVVTADDVLNAGEETNAPNKDVQKQENPEHTAIKNEFEVLKENDEKRERFERFGNPSGTSSLPNRTKFLADRAGINSEGAPSSVRAQASFGDTPILGGDALAPAKAALDKHFGQDVQVKIGELTEELEFSLDGKKWNLFNKPGADLGDVAGFSGEGIVLASDVTGTLAGASAGAVLAAPTVVGAPAGATFGAITGSGAGTFAGEVTRQLIGRGLDVNDSSMEDIVKDAALKAGISVAATVTMTGLLKLGKGILNKVKGRQFDSTPEELGLDKPETLETIKQINEAIEKEFAPRASQQGDDALRLIDEGFSTKPSLGKHKKFQEQDAKNMSALEEFEARASGKFQTNESSIEAGKNVQESISKNITEPSLKAADDIVQPTITKADDVATSIEEADLLGIGQTIRGVAQKEQDALEATFKGRFDEFNTSKFKSEGGELRNISKSIKSESDKSLIPSLTASDKKLASEIESSLTKETRVVDFFKNIDETIKEGKKVTLGQIQVTLKGINKKIRNLERGLTSDDTSIASLKRIKGKLKSERQIMLKDNPDVLNKIEGLENELRLAKDKVDRSIIGDIMKVNKGRFAIKDQDIFKRVISPGKLEESKRLAEAVQDNPEAQDAVRKGILDLYKSKVFIKDSPLDSGVKIPDKRAHEIFMKQYKDVIEPFLTKAELKTIDSVGVMSKLIDRQLKQRTDMLGKIKKLVSTKVESLDPEKIATYVMDGTLTGRAITLRKLLDKDPAALKSIQSEITKRVKNLITKDDKFSFEALNTILNSTNKENLSAIVSPEYVANLTVLRNGLKLLQKKSGLSGGVDSSSDSFAGFIKGLFRAVFAPPLAQRGRLFTAVESGSNTASTRSLGEAIESPEKLKAVISAMKLKGSTKRTAEILSSVGMLHLTFPDQP